jgi:hypothetical protein
VTPIPVSCIGLCDVGAFPEAVQLKHSDILDELEKSMLELRSLAGALTAPCPESERVRGDGVDSLTLGAAPAGDMPPVG